MLPGRSCPEAYQVSHATTPARVWAVPGISCLEALPFIQLFIFLQGSYCVGTCPRPGPRQRAHNVREADDRDIRRIGCDAVLWALVANSGEFSSHSPESTAWLGHPVGIYMKLCCTRHR